MSDNIANEKIDEQLRVYLNDLLYKFTAIYTKLIYNVFKNDFATYWQDVKNSADSAIKLGKTSFFYECLNIYNNEHFNEYSGHISFTEDEIKNNKSKRDELFKQSEDWSQDVKYCLFDFQEYSKQLLYNRNIGIKFGNYYNAKFKTYSDYLNGFIELRNAKAHCGEIDIRGIFQPKQVEKTVNDCKAFINICKGRIDADSGSDDFAKQIQDEFNEFSKYCEELINKVTRYVKIKDFIAKYDVKSEDVLIRAVRAYQKDFSKEYIFGLNDLELKTIYDNYRQNQGLLDLQDNYRESIEENKKQLEEKERELKEQGENLKRAKDKAQKSKNEAEYWKNKALEAEHNNNEEALREAREKEREANRIADEAATRVADAERANEKLRREKDYLINYIKNNSASAKDEPSDSGNKSSGSGIGCLIIIIAIILIGVFIIRPIVNHSKEKKAEKASVSTSVSQVEENRGTKLVEFSDVAKDDAVSVVTDYTDTDNYGNKYDNNLYASAPYSMITYNLGGKFDKLSGTWYLSENGKNTDKKHYFKIIVDGETVYTSPTLEKGSAPKEVKADLKFGKEMTVIFVSDDSAGFGNPAISCSDSSKAKSLEGDIVVPAWLTSIAPLKADDNINITDYSDNSSFPQTQISHYLTGDTTDYNDEGTQISKIKKAEFLLDGKYSKLSGLWVFTEYGKDSNSKCQFEMYADGKLVYTSDVIDASSEPKEFTVDINNCDKLTIAFTSGDGSAALSSVLLY